LFNKPAIEVVRLKESRQINDYQELVAHLPELGDRFPVSIKNWCGIGTRPSVLKFWQIYIALQSENSIGITGLYQQPITKKNNVWLGWFGILPSKRGIGMGAKMLYETEKKAAGFGFSKMHVYTDPDPSITRKFYEKHGYQLFGKARDVCDEVTNTPEDLVLAKII